MSQCVWEGRQIVNASRRYDRLIQCGTQARSSVCNQQAVEYVRSGKLGKIQYVSAPASSRGRASASSTSRWRFRATSTTTCGAARRRRSIIYRPHLHYDWHWDFNTGCGDIGNQGVHQMDVARWFLGEQQLAPRVISVGGRLGYEDAGNTPNSQIVLFDYAAAPLIFETRGLPKSKAAQQAWDSSMDNYRGSQIGVIVQCEHGHVYSSSSYTTVEAFGPDGEQIEQWRGGGDHFRNFLDALRSGRREDLNAEVLEGHLSSALCHTANVSHRLGEKRTAAEIGSRPPATPLLAESIDRLLAHLRANDIDVDSPTVTLGPWLEFDPTTERFTNNESANHSCGAKIASRSSCRRLLRIAFTAFTNSITRQRCNRFGPGEFWHFWWRSSTIGGQQFAAAEVTVERSEKGAVVKIDGKPFAEYLTRSGHQPAVWPIIGPTGKAMTRSYPAGPLSTAR